MNLNLVKNLCSLREEQLYTFLVKVLYHKGYKKIWREAGFIAAEGEIPICLLAHMDTVFSYVPYTEDFYYDSQKKVLWSPFGSGFDDRAGIAIILELLERGYRPHIIFTDKEEVGGVGAHELVKRFPRAPFDCKMLIQLDRANENDCVFYQCDNHKFEDYISSFGFKYAEGTFSDISVIAPSWKIAAVNLSVGYENEHSYAELLHCNWCNKTIDKVESILLDVERVKHFKYIPKKCKPTKIYGRYYDYNSTNTTGIDTCLMCGTPINSYKEAYFFNEKGYNYAVCRDCYKLYGFEGVSDGEEPDEQIPF